MAGNAINTQDFQLAAKPSVIDQLRDKVNRPEDIDRATKELGLEPRLLNLHLSTVVDLTSVGLGPALHIPVQVSTREGGRKSLYFLNVDEEVLAGIFVRELGVILRYVKRTSGKSSRAETGDTYTERLANLAGDTLWESSGPLEVVDAEKGQGHISFSNASLQSEAVTNREWWLWSCIYFWDET